MFKSEQVYKQYTGAIQVKGDEHVVDVLMKTRNQKMMDKIRNCFIVA